MSQALLANFPCGSRLSGGFRLVFILACLAATAPIVLTSRAAAQTVDHARIEELFKVLQMPGVVGSGLSLHPLAAPMSVDTALRPAPSPAPMISAGQSAGKVPASPDDKSDDLDIPSVPFSDVAPDGSDCPSDPKAFEAALSETMQLVSSYESRMVELSKAYDEMDAENLSLVTSDVVSCPEEMRSSYKAFLDDIEMVRIADNILPAESLQLCSQTTATRYERQITAIGVDASRADQNRRMTLSRMMRSVAGLDEMATEVVRRMVSLEQKRQRLISGINQFEQACDDSEGLSFSAEYE